MANKRKREEKYVAILKTIKYAFIHLSLIQQSAKKRNGVKLPPVTCSFLPHSSLRLNDYTMLVSKRSLITSHGLIDLCMRVCVFRIVNLHF